MMRRQSKDVWTVRKKPSPSGRTLSKQSVAHASHSRQSWRCWTRRRNIYWRFQIIENFARTRKFYPWFYVLLRNRCYKMTARKRETENIEENEILAPREGLPEEERFALEKALLSLSKEDREIVTLKYLDGLSYDELAEHLQIPKGTVRSRLFSFASNCRQNWRETHWKE